MRPWIWPGGRLWVRRCGVDDLAVGDIAVWFDGRRLLSHRVVRLGVHGQFVTRGDLRLQNDDATNAHQLLGKAAAFAKGPIRYRLDGPHMRQLGRLTAAIGLVLQRLRTKSV